MSSWEVGNLETPNYPARFSVQVEQGARKAVVTPEDCKSMLRVLS